MIESIRELQHIKATQENTIREINQEQLLAKERIQEQAKDIASYLNTLDQTSKDNQQLKKDIEHWKEEGRLNDSDLKTLKE